MAIYTNISSIATTTLVAKEARIGRNSGSGRGHNYVIDKIVIANHDNTDLVIVKLYLYDGTNTYVLTETTIPALTTLVLDDNLSFDRGLYDLKIDTSTTAEITVTIK
tara:strand:+ start:386 stop:706 length:321 start_codon:yes stop_codon:yes gene_type:complete